MQYRANGAPLYWACFNVVPAPNNLHSKGAGTHLSFQMPYGTHLVMCSVEMQPRLGAVICIPHMQGDNITKGYLLTALNCVLATDARWSMSTTICIPVFSAGRLTHFESCQNVFRNEFGLVGRISPTLLNVACLGYPRHFASLGRSLVFEGLALRA